MCIGSCVASLVAHHHHFRTYCGLTRHCHRTQFCWYYCLRSKAMILFSLNRNELRVFVLLWVTYRIFISIVVLTTIAQYTRYQCFHGRSNIRAISSWQEHRASDFLLPQCICKQCEVEMMIGLIDTSQKCSHTQKRNIARIIFNVIFR